MIKVLRSELQTAIDSSYKVLRNRIDRFGVVAPNIQRLEGGDRILVELPGVKEPERVRKLLQGSANLEFWECYLLPEIWSDLQRADEVIQRLNSHSQSTETEVANAEEIEGDSLASDSNPLKELAGSKVTEVLDYQSLKSLNTVTGETKEIVMPTTSNVLQYRCEDGTKLSIRPSGTEPKIKFYIEVHAQPTNLQELEEAKKVCARRADEIAKQLGI